MARLVGYTVYMGSATVKEYLESGKTLQPGDQLEVRMPQDRKPLLTVQLVEDKVAHASKHRRVSRGRYPRKIRLMWSATVLAADLSDLLRDRRTKDIKFEEGQQVTVITALGKHPSVSIFPG